MGLPPFLGGRAEGDIRTYPIVWSGVGYRGQLPLGFFCYHIAEDAECFEL